MYMYGTWTKLAILVVTHLIVKLQWGNKGGEGEKEVETIMCIYMYTRVTTCLNAKKGGEPSKSKLLRLLKRGILGWPTCKGDKIGIAWS